MSSTSTSTSPLAVTLVDGVLELRLDRPDALNALDPGLGRALRDALEAAADDPTVRVVVVSASGRAFCSGWDLRAQGGLAEGESILGDIVNPAVLALREMPKPVVARVQGVAAGVGVSLAAASDFVVAGESASFLLAFARVGLSGDGGITATLPARVGIGRAAQMMTFAEKVPASDAAEWGLVDRVVPDADLDATTTALAERLAGGPTRSYAATKALLNASVLPALREQLAREATTWAELRESADHREGKLAFVEKRRPVFTGS
ncbi:hypothetical protein ASD11_00895 [Aeromicrobium sp. Root495]|uniref:enoyl-CoA hydratase-related protein n=1 Tax=Aeromicrobium sp. Root495 TaxID=1736550 RepID=UPI0006F4E7B7|nr:enoyl-CoA hydratase-related protein [Aeromicrobium sp. Root495]KQY58259.1 hypothetical protein ASD11_00895 [Aeromicrobium sp. Root495]